MELRGGYISALIVSTGPSSYRDQQLQQWGWTNNPPLPLTTLINIFDVTWSVSGSGSKFIDMSSSTHMHTSSLAWIESGSLPVKLQARMSGSQLIIDNSGNQIVLTGGLNGTNQDTYDGKVTTTQLIASVNGLPVPSASWNGQQSARRVPDGSEQPTLASSTLPSSTPTKNRLGALLGQPLPLRNAWFGSLHQPMVPPGGTQAAGATATADWSWRLYYSS